MNEILRETLEALKNCGENAHWCVADFYKLDAANDQPTYIRNAWLLRACEYEFGIYNPITKRIGAWCAKSSHPMAPQWKRMYV